MVGRLRRFDRRRRTDARRDQEFPEAPQGQGHRRAHHVRARRSGRRRQGARGRIRLERGGRSGNRRAHRPADQAGAARARRRARHALVFGARRGAGRDLPLQAAGTHARRAVRAREEGTANAPDRIERAARRRFLHRRHAGAENVRRARQAARRRDPRLHRAVRPDDGDHRRAGDGGDGGGLLALPRRAARRLPRWPNRWNTATAWW